MACARARQAYISTTVVVELCAVSRSWRFAGSSIFSVALPLWLMGSITPTSSAVALNETGHPHGHVGRSQWGIVVIES
ncbi:hypothetical protein FYJ24_04275 [Actinomycetaceae bacterium WB03_NA08]|uniref:Uncharacterized protein n=1 Tax=Scrofimicrobium canadense TaxID=2652290 RepID=A0A6N7W670_9ACTO|nr:hypothetical protein [Scrofimicrobium canadense]MSS83993.1 hypothetical protein [Scrofimicrobium canadense]